MNKLEKYLKHYCISQRGFARKLNITPNNLNLLVKGKSKPRICLAYEIEKLTEGYVTVYDWVDESAKNCKDLNLISSDNEINGV